MFGLFKSKEQKLRDKYRILMEESFNLSKINRKASDEKYAEAEAVMVEIELLNKKD